MACDETLSQEPVAVEIADTMAGASLSGGGWISKTKWGLDTGRLSAWVAVNKVSNVGEYNYLPR